MAWKEYSKSIIDIPPSNVLLLCRIDNGKYRICSYYKETWWDPEAFDWNPRIVEGVTHWMRLPPWP